MTARCEPPLADYTALVALAERELALVHERAWGALAALVRRRAELVNALSAHPAPARARPALERAATLQAQVTAALAAAQEPIASELARLASGRRGIGGYGRERADRPAPGRRVERRG